MTTVWPRLRNQSGFTLPELLVAAAVIAFGMASAQADAFYVKRQVTLLMGNNVGSDYDISGRLVGRHSHRSSR